MSEINSHDYEGWLYRGGRVPKLASSASESCEYLVHFVPLADVSSCFRTYGFMPVDNTHSVVKKQQFAEFCAVIFPKLMPMLAHDVQRKL